MMLKKYFVTALLVALVGFWGNAFALEGEYTTPSFEDNQKHLDAALAATEGAIAAAKGGNTEDAYKLAKESKAHLNEINSEQWAGTIEGAKGKIRVGGVKVKKGDAETGIKMMEEGLARLKTLEQQ